MRSAKGGRGPEGKCFISRRPEGFRRAWCFLLSRMQSNAKQAMQSNGVPRSAVMPCLPFTYVAFPLACFSLCLIKEKTVIGVAPGSLRHEILKH